jgi:hypothetical protein
MNYFIAVEIEPQRATSEIFTALRQAFDNGLSGDFKPNVTHNATYMIIFQRARDVDYEHINARMLEGSTLSTAAMSHLASELEQSGVGDAATEILDVLKNGDAQCFDFEGFF